MIWSQARIHLSRITVVCKHRESVRILCKQCGKFAHTHFQQTTVTLQILTDMPPSNANIRRMCMRLPYYKNSDSYLYIMIIRDQLYAYNNHTVVQSCRVTEAIVSQSYNDTNVSEPETLTGSFHMHDSQVFPQCSAWNCSRHAALNMWSESPCVVADALKNVNPNPNDDATASFGACLLWFAFVRIRHLNIAESMDSHAESRGLESRLENNVDLFNFYELAEMITAWEILNPSIRPDRVSPLKSWIITTLTSSLCVMQSASVSAKPKRSTYVNTFWIAM